MTSTERPEFADQDRSLITRLKEFMDQHFALTCILPTMILVFGLIIVPIYLRCRGVFCEIGRHSCESRNPETFSSVNLDARFRGHDKKNTPTPHILSLPGKLFLDSPGHYRFVGIKHYLRIFQSIDFWRYLYHTIQYSGFSSLFSFLFGLILTLSFGRTSIFFYPSRFGC